MLEIMADWANLPEDMLILIAQCFQYMEDLISLCGVCKPWHSVVTSILLEKKPVLPPRFPWVMLTETEEANKLDEDEKGKVQIRHLRQFYSFSTSTIYNIELPEASNRRCLSAGYGWIFTVGYDLQINLLHPFSRQQIKLPHMLTFPDQYNYDEGFKPERVVDMFVTKVVMSKNPRSNKFFEVHDGNDWIIVAIYGGLRVLAFARPGDRKWTNICVSSKVHEDIAYYQGKFYVVDCHGALFVCEFDDENGPTTTRLAAPAPPGTHDDDQKYLVESSGDLLVVCRFRKLFHEDMEVLPEDEDEFDPKRLKFWTVGFSVWKLEEYDENNEGINYEYNLTEVKDLGGRALFLGNNTTKFVSSSECVRPNCIYFGEDDVTMYRGEPKVGGHDTGIFDMINGTVESHFAAKFCCPLCPPMWYI